MSIFTLLALIHFISVGTDSLASCIFVPDESFSAEFKVASKETPTVQCTLGEKNQFIKPIGFSQKGCILGLEIVKIRKGRIPYKNFEKSGIYSIYDGGKLCGLKTGDKLQATVKSLAVHCCSVKHQVEDEEGIVCIQKPEIKLAKEPSSEYLECSNSKVNWRIVKDIGAK